MRQVGPAVEVSFQVPEPRGDRPGQQPVLAELLRVEFTAGLEPGSDPDAFRRRGVVVDSLSGNPMKSGERARLRDESWVEFPNGGVGWTVRYAVRVRDRRSRPSPLVVARDLVLVKAPPPPRDLRAEPTADGIRLTWDPPAGEGPFRYNVYRAPAGRPYGARPIHGETLGSPEYLDTAVETGSEYAYAVRTAASEEPPYRESVSSATVRLVAEDRFPPVAPEGLVAVQEGSAVRLFWNPNQETDLAGYRVYRRTNGAWERIGPDPVPEPLFLDAGVDSGASVLYRVTAVDRADPPNESPPSDAVRIRVAADDVRPVESPDGVNP